MAQHQTQAAPLQQPLGLKAAIRQAALVMASLWCLPQLRPSWLPFLQQQERGLTVVLVLWSGSSQGKLTVTGQPCPAATATIKAASHKWVKQGSTLRFCAMLNGNMRAFGGWVHHGSYPCHVCRQIGVPCQSTRQITA